MTERIHILFCESPLESKQPDEAFADQYSAAVKNGFSTLIFNFEDLISTDRFSLATRRIKPAESMQTAVYRGWMLTPERYGMLYNDLLSKNFRLINAVEEYRNCHWLPDSLKFIGEHTPKTVFEKFDSEDSIDRLIGKTAVFGQKSVVLKDYVKSEKHSWNTACFVENASDTETLRKSIENFIKLRSDSLNEGIVIREFADLNFLAVHSKSGMPLAEEYRLFFLNRKLVGIYDYWEEGEYNLPKPDTSEFEKIAEKIESRFFSMDIARKKDGEFIIIELGDGQTAGLPDRTDRNEFYERLKFLSADPE